MRAYRIRPDISRAEADARGAIALRRAPYQWSFVGRLRGNPTPAERVLWGRLKASQTGYKYRRQVTILKYVVDFYCPATGLIVELDGGYHLDLRQAAYDARRDKELMELGLTVLRFPNAAVMDSTDTVLARIAEAGTQLARSYPVRHRAAVAFFRSTFSDWPRRSTRLASIRAAPGDASAPGASATPTKGPTKAPGATLPDQTHTYPNAKELIVNRDHDSTRTQCAGSLWVADFYELAALYEVLD
jgi:very-short-patch-repair endonuclease